MAPEFRVPRKRSLSLQNFPLAGSVDHAFPVQEFVSKPVSRFQVLSRAVGKVFKDPQAT
jgi:hypothetical protein